MAQEPPEGSAGEMMVYGLIQHADEIGKSARATQRDLTEQIQQLTQLRQWTVQAALELQKQADAAIQKIAAERIRLQATQADLQTTAAQAIREAVRSQASDIERQTVTAFSAPLRDIEQAAAYVRQNIKEVKWLTISLIFFAGLAIGLAIGYLPLNRGQNAIEEQLNRIEQFQEPPTQPMPATSNPHVPARQGKAK